MFMGIILIIMSDLIEGIYVTYFFSSLGASRIFVPITFILKIIGLVGLFASIAYLLGSIIIDLIPNKKWLV